MRTAPDDDPIHSTATRELVLRAIPSPDGLPQQKSFGPADRELRLPPLQFGKWQFVVQALDADGVIATGQTPLVDVTGEGSAIPCLYFATVGTFGNTTNSPPDSAPKLVFGGKESLTALVATEAGLVPYDHETGEFSAETIAAPVASARATWTSLLGGRAAVIATDGRGAILTAEGDVESLVQLDDTVGPLDGVAAVGVGVTTVLLVGGAADAASLPATEGSIRVVDLVDGGSVTLLREELPVRDARIEDLGNATFVVVGGNSGSAESPEPSDLVAIVDPHPDDPAHPIAGMATLDVPRRDPIVAFTGPNLLVFGGRDASGELSTAIERFRVSSGVPVHRPSVGVLQRGRAGGLALVTGDEIVIVGGQTALPEDEGKAERFTFAQDDTVDADPPGVPLPSLVAGSLFDGTRLVVGRGAAVVYRP